tara:strand:+ start:81 stop:617 length:537 start_codon:yes stop_codon:yes gene_type:complete
MKNSGVRVLSMLLVAMGVIGFGLTSVGCGSTAYKKFTVDVSLDSTQNAGQPVTVDLVALGGDRAAELDAMPMRKYWTQNDPYRQSLLSQGVLWTVELSEANPTATLGARDKIWNTPTWKSGGKLFVLAELRGVGPGPNGDPRRRSILREANLWDQSKIAVTVRPSGISYSPTEKAVAR